MNVFIGEKPPEVRTTGTPNTTKKRVLVVGPTLGSHGGIEAFSASIARELHEHGGFDVQLVFRLRGGGDLKPDFLRALAELDFPCHVLRGVGPAIVRYIRWADLINCHFPLIDVTFPSALLGKMLVLSIENRRCPEHRLWHRLGLLAAHQRWYISKFVAKTWEGENLHQGSAVVPATSELPRFSTEPQLRSGFLFIARWVPRKGLEELIMAYDSAAIIHQRHPLTLVGDGPLKPKITEMIAQAKTREFMRVVGFVSTTAKHQLLASARWNVAPAAFEEDLGLTPIESRACGIPSIVSDIGGLPEAAGPAALLCRPGDVASLRRCLEHAAAMPEGEYARRAIAAKESLANYLPGAGFYAESFLKLLAG
jgi:glycosyltransferase involved in cell wall biosynthesis